MFKRKKTRNMGFANYKFQLQLLETYLKERIDSENPLLVNVKFPAKRKMPTRVVSELDLLIDAVLTGIEKANLSTAETATIEKMEAEIREKFGENSNSSQLLQ